MEFFVCGLAMGFVLTFVFTIKQRWDLEDKLIESKNEARHYKKEYKKYRKGYEKMVKLAQQTEVRLKEDCDLGSLYGKF